MAKIKHSHRIRTRSMEEALNQKMLQLATEIGKPLAARRGRPPKLTATYDTLVEIATRTLQQKIKEHDHMTASHDAKRTELTDSYRIRMEKLQAEVNEQLRTMDAEHAEQSQSLEKLIEKLKAFLET